MNVSNENAQESLTAIKDIMTQTNKSIAAAYTSPFLILWGLICITAYVGTHFFLELVWYIWLVLGGLGVIATFVISWWQFHYSLPTKSPSSKKIGWRIFGFWSLLYVYIFLWLLLLTPFSGLQLNAFIVTAIMFAYVVQGLWFTEYFMIWLGLAVTLTTFSGVYLIPHSYYCLWMALTAGGGVLGTGLYIRFRWR